ncbi:uncharacterized protein LOC103996295 [Musa acuminata AAA Group]|uniref:uncharacterized protein LOC103996295 n=1 Tax=Musa acuminata AAA Group TaxID=214697 RepID=UPI0031DB65B0
MKKLGNGKGRRVHPVPPPGAALPAAVMALAAVLTAEDQEVLAYLLSGGGGRWREQRRRRAHPPELECGCFGCYKSFWARWDASPNRHVIHRIIDAVEESLEARECDRGGGGRRRRRSGRGGNKGAILAPNATAVAEAEEAADSLRVEGKVSPALDAEHFPHDDGDDYDDDDGEDEDDEDDDEEEQEMNESNNNNKSKNSVRRFMSFIGETVWGVWN